MLSSLSSSAVLAVPNLSPKPANPTPPSSKLRFRSRFGSSAAAAYVSSERTSTRTSSNHLLRPHRMASGTSLYQILGIPMGASSQEIKAAYRRLARTVHPDVAAIDRKDTSASEFMKINTAYSTLSDPKKRADYDRNLVVRRYRPLTAMSSGFSGYTCRNWETDQCW